MHKTSRAIKAFTLIELMLVIVLISSISFLLLTNFKFSSQKNYEVSLENLKEFMLKNFQFQNELNLTCIEDEKLDCYIFIDRNYNKDNKIENLFKEIPQVYNYDKELSDYEFGRIRLEDISFEPFFELIITKDKKHKNIVIDTLDDKVFLYSSIEKKTKVFESTNEILDRFSDLEIEVKDGF